MMYQSITIVGNCGRNPEMRFTSAGVACADFSVAVNERWTDRQSNEQKERVTWFRITCWNRLAETVNEHVSKGQQVMVVGTVEASAYTGKDGEAHATLELRAFTVKFLGRRDEGNQGSQIDGRGHSGQRGGQASDVPQTDDIPF